MVTLNSILEENKLKDVLVHISPQYTDSKFGRYCNIVFKIDGKEMCYGLTTNMLLSIIELHFSDKK